MDDFDFGGKVLYDRGGIRIHAGNTPETYDVVAKGNCLSLDGGMMEDWLSGGIEGVVSGFKANAGVLDSGMIAQDLGISHFELAFAMSQAKLKIVENERNYWITEANK